MADSAGLADPASPRAPVRCGGGGGAAGGVLAGGSRAMLKRIAVRLWDDDGGALIAMEFLFVATILVIGIIVGLVGLRDAVVAELTELGNAVLALNPGFAF